MEIEEDLIKFKYLRDTKNTIADAVSRLVELDPDNCQDPEPEG